MTILQKLLDNNELIETINSLKVSNLVIDFHKLYYESDFTWKLNKYRGIPILKFAADIHMYQELISTVKPNLIIETGTAFGGSALYFSDLQKVNNIRPRKVITIDIDNYEGRPRSKDIRYIKGDSLNDKIVNEIKKESKKYKKIMVVLDSNHSSDHVYKELNTYNKFVSKHSYLVVEDCNLGNTVMQHVKDILHREVGPLVAVNLFLKENDDFVNDSICERQLVSCNLGGYLFKRGK